MLAELNRIVVSGHVQVVVETFVLTSLGPEPRRSIAGSHENCSPNYRLIFRLILLFSITINNCSVSATALGIIRVFIFNILIGMSRYIMEVLFVFL